MSLIEMSAAALWVEPLWLLAAPPALGDTASPAPLPCAAASGARRKNRRTAARPLR